MVSLKKQKGFTLVELLIVIIIIGILATLVIVTFTGVQAKARDSKRQTSIEAVDSHLEAFYAENGYYPTVIDLQDITASTGWVATNMKGLDPAALSDPNSTPTATAATITGAAPVTSPATYVYSYQAGGTGCDNTKASDKATNACSSFTLTAVLESGGTFVKKSNT